MAPKNHITPRSSNGMYEYCRRVPRAVAHLDGRRKVVQSLGTRDYDVALQKARAIDDALDELWGALISGENATETWGRYKAAVDVAKAMGFQYRRLKEVSESSVEEIVARVLKAHMHKDTPVVVEALMGTAPDPVHRLSGLWGMYEKHNAGGFHGMSENQMRKHKVPRERAINYAVAQMGDKVLREITRDDVLEFRDWWVEKMTTEKLKADSINRCFSDIKGMLKVVDAALRTHYRDIWSGVRVEATNATGASIRKPFPNDFMEGTFLKPGALDFMNFEARMIVYGMVETGMSPSETCNLRAEDIKLDAKIPHVVIPVREDRRLKTDYRPRSIPLAGVSLWAFQQAPGGFPRYRDKEDGLSTLVNRLLRENNLRPEGTSLYSLRHNFQDRILRANAPDRVQADLMGHEFDRPSYGDGASLEQKLELLDRIQFRWDPPIPP